MNYSYKFYTKSLGFQVQHTNGIQHSEYVSTDATHQKETIHLSVPQGSIQEAFLFIAYASTIPDIIPD